MKKTASAIMFDLLVLLLTCAYVVFIVVAMMMITHVNADEQHAMSFIDRDAWNKGFLPIGGGLMYLIYRWYYAGWYARMIDGLVKKSSAHEVQFNHVHHASGLQAQLAHLAPSLQYHIISRLHEHMSADPVKRNDDTYWQNVTAFLIQESHE